MRCQPQDVFDLELEVIAQQSWLVYNRITPERPFEYRRRDVIEEARRRAIIESIGESVRCIETGEVFPTVRAAAKWLVSRAGIDASVNTVGSAISAASHEPRTRSVHGYRFARPDNPVTVDELGPLTPVAQRRGPPRVPVRCIETGAVFQSSRDAADWLLAQTGRDIQRASAASMISSAMRKPGATVHGYRFERVEAQQ